MADKESLWATLESQPSFQSLSPNEKLEGAKYFLEKQSERLAPSLAGNPEAQEYFREKSKQFLFKVAEDHLPNALQAIPSQIGESLAREGRAWDRRGIERAQSDLEASERQLSQWDDLDDGAMVDFDPTLFNASTPAPGPIPQMEVSRAREMLRERIDLQRRNVEEGTKDLAESFSKSAERTPSAAMLQLELSEGWAGWDDYISTNLKNEENVVGKAVDLVGSVGAAVTGLMTESSAQSAAGMGAGIMATVATGNPLIGGAAMGAVAADSEFQATYLQELQSELQERGGDVSAKAIQEILADDEWNKRVEDKAMTRGVTIGAVEGVAGMLSFGIAQKIGTGTARKALIATGADTAVSGVGGSGGEFLARLFSGDDIWTPDARKDIVSEGVAELGQGTAGVTAAALSRQPADEPHGASTADPDAEPSPPTPAEPESSQDFDDGRVRSVMEEFESETSEETSLSDLPENEPQTDLPITDEPQLEAPTVEDSASDPEIEASPEVEAGDAEAVSVGFAPVERTEIQSTNVADGLDVRLIQEPDGRVSVEKVNTETGETIPLIGAEQPFPDRRAANQFLGDTFRSDEFDADAYAAPDSDATTESRGETDPLMIYLSSQRIRPKQASIREIGRASRRKVRGARGISRDTSRIADYDDAPLIRDYAGPSQDRLRSIYARQGEQGTDPDVVAQNAYNENPSWLAGPTAVDLYAAIKARLDRPGGETVMSSVEMAESAARNRDLGMEGARAMFDNAIRSPYRRGGVVSASQLEVGDVLEVDGDTMTVTEKDEDGISIRSQRLGEHSLGSDEQVGYDSISTEGLPVSEREGLPPSDVVSRDEASELTTFLRERLNRGGGNSKARAVSSREHSALAKSRQELDAARRLARLFGRRVVGVSDFEANGAISRQDDKNIYIATDSTRPELLVTAHELLHQLRQTDNDLYQELLATLGVEFDADGNLVAVGADLQSYIDEVRPEHGDAKETVLVEEFLADYLAERASDPTFWQSLATRNPSLFDRFADFVLQFLRDIRDRILSDKIKVEKYLHDQSAMRDALEGVIVAFRARQSQEDRGILDTPLSESLPFDDDLPFSDRRTKPNQQLFGQEIGRGDEIQGMDELRGVVRENYFDGETQVSYWSREEAFRVLSDIESGAIDPVRETGLDAASQVLKGELWSFANRLIREEGDDSLFQRMRGKANDYFDRESTRAGRALNALGWYTRQIDQVFADVEKAKRETVNRDAGSDSSGKQLDVAKSLDDIQRDIDSILTTIADFTPEEISSVTNFVAAHRGTPSEGNIERAVKILGGSKKSGKRTKALASELDEFLSGGAGDVMFSDPSIAAQDREWNIRRILEEQIRSGKRKRTRFMRDLQRLGMSEEVAANRFEKAMEFRERAKEARRLDAEDAKAQEVEPTDPEAIRERQREENAAAWDEESKRLDRLNEKARKLAERLKAGPKKRAKADPSKKSDVQRLVESSIAEGESFSREETIKAGIRMGLDQSAAAALSDAIEAEIKDRSSRKRKPKTVDDKAREIVKRFDEPREQNPRAVDPLRKLVSDTLRKDSKIDEAGFMAAMKGFGASQTESADLWNAVSKERVERNKLREMHQRQKEAEKPDADAMRIIKNLAASQSDTQDNRPAAAKEATILDIYRDYVSHGAYGERPGPAMSRPGFVEALIHEGVSQNEANMLATLATRERQNRLETARGKASVRAIERSVPFIMREILAHPSLRLVGPEERLRIMAKIFEDRAGMSPVDARAAATRFNAMLSKKWDEAAKRLAEKYAAKRNAPWFRREPGQGVGRKQKTLFDKIREAVRAGALDPRRRVLDEVAKSNGWVDLTDAEVRELSELDAALEQPDLTEFEEIRLKRRMLMLVQKSALPPSVMKAISETYVANIFSGPSTMMLGFWAMADSLATVPRDFVASAIGSANKGGRIADSRNLTGFAAAIGRSHRNFAAAFNDALVTLRTGDMRNTMADELTQSISTLDRVWARLVPVLSDPNASVLKKSGAFTTLLATSARFGLRVLAAADSFTRGVNRRYLTELELFSKAANLGWSKKRIQSLLANVAVETNRLAEIADQKGFKGSDKRAFVNDRLAMEIYAAFRGEGVEMDPSTMERATREASLPTGMGEIQIGTLMLPGASAMGAKHVSTKGGMIGKMAVPAVQTPYNAFHRSAWYSPYGLVRLLGTAYHTSGFRNWEKTHYPEALADPTQLLLRSIEVALGNAVLGTLASAIIDQLGEDDEDKRWLWINLGGPSTATGASLAERSAWLSTGRRPFTLQLKFGDEKVTAAFRRGGLEPFNFPFTLFGAADQMKYERSRFDTPAEKYLSILVKELAGESMFFLRSFTSRGFSRDRSRIGSEVGYRMSGFVPWASFLKTPNRFEDMPQSPEGFWENVAWQMPLVPQMNDREPALNALGMPVGFNETSPGYQQSRVGIPVGTVPTPNLNRTSSNPTNQDVLLLLHDKHAFPSDHRKSDLDRSAGRETTPEEFRSYIKTRGEGLTAFINENYKELWTLDQERFQDVLGDASERISKQAKRSLGFVK